MEVPSATTTIRGLFDGARQFCVPPYQRAYSWQVGDGDQVGQFLRDIREQGSGRTYYLGHFLFEKPDGAGALRVIDGQQRLTTIVIFMSTLLSECERRGVVSLGETTTEEIAATYLEQWGRRKFRTVGEDDTYFNTRMVMRDPRARRTTSRKSEGRIADAADFLAREMRDVATEELADWYRVVSNAVATTYTISGSGAKEIAAQIFAYQNDRGKGLTSLEKVKAWLMNQIYKYSEANDADANVDVVEKNFSAIYDRTETLRESEDSVLRWHCQAYISISGVAVLDIVKRALSSSEGKLQWILAFSAMLAETFRFVYDFEQIEERRGGLVADICYLGKASAMPLLIKLRHYGKLGEDCGNCEVLELVESILFKLTFKMSPYRTNDLPRFALDFDGESFETGLLPRLRNTAEHGFQWYWDFTGSCRRFFTENRFHYFREIKYVLYKYENYLRGKRSEAPLNIDECRGIFRENKTVENTLDHIAPQNPDYTTYSDEFRRDYLSNIGNLSLLTWSGNSAKRDHDPTLPGVRDRYDTPQRSQREIFETLCAGRWGKDEIDARRKRIVDFVIKNWKLA